MILQALYELAKHERLMGDPDFEHKPVAWLVRVGDGGRLLGIESTHYTPEAKGKRKPKPVAKTYEVPREPSGRSGTKAPSCFLVDNSKYVFGLSTEDRSFSPEEGREKSSWFAALVEECASDTGDPGAIAVDQLLKAVANDQQPITLPGECRSNDRIAFVYEPDIDTLVHQRPAVREWWQQRRRSNGRETTGKCVVTGADVSEPALFPPVSNPQPSLGLTPLVSFNASAFCSYGWVGKDGRKLNATLSREAAEACATALDRLLSLSPVNGQNEPLPRRHLRLSSDTVVCYWSNQPPREGNGLLDQLGALMEAADPEQVGDRYHSLWKGRPSEIEDPARFYAMTITGAQGRLIVRDWLETSVAEVDRNLARHFADLAIVRNTPPPKGREHPPAIPLHVLGQALAPMGRSDNVPAHVAAELVHAALRGTLYPRSILHKALQRARAEATQSDWAAMQRRDARAALIKAVLNRLRARMEPPTPYPEVNVAMDPNNTSAGYLLGRMMAVVENMQQLALGKQLNATVVDKFFSSASATPAAVFPTLLRKFRQHARKAKDDSSRTGIAINLEKEADDILSKLDTIPRHLPIHEQGLFVLGYHQQRHHLWHKPETAETSEPEDELAAQPA